MKTSLPIQELGQSIRFMTSGSRGWAKYYAKSGASFLRIQNVGKNQMLLDDIAYVDAPNTTEAKRTAVEPGDVLLSVTADLGRAAVVPEGLGPAHINQHLVLIRVKDNICPRFLAAFLSSPLAMMQFQALNREGVKAALNFDDVKSLKIPLPPLPEQKRIAGILDKADSIRRKRQQAIGLTEQFLRSTFLDMFGDPVTNPKGWAKVKLEELCTVRRGGSPRPIKEFLGGNIPWIKIGDATKGDDTYIHGTKETIIEKGLSKTVQLDPGALIFANCGVSLGFARILKISGCIHDGWLSFSDLDPKRLNKLFLLKSLNQITDYFRAIAPDGTQPNLTTSIMKEYELPLPPLALQTQFEAILERNRIQSTKQSASFEQFDNLFNSLVQRAFKGEL